MTGSEKATLREFEISVSRFSNINALNLYLYMLIANKEVCKDNHFGGDFRFVLGYFSNKIKECPVAAINNLVKQSLSPITDGSLDISAFNFSPDSIKDIEAAFDFRRLPGIVDPFEENKQQNTLILDSVSFLIFRTRRFRERELAEELVKIISSILSIQDSDLYVDLTTGFGLNSFRIIGNNHPEMILNDINTDRSTICYVLSKVLGFEKCQVLAKDSLFGSTFHTLKADKIFFNAPNRPKTLREGTDSNWKHRDSLTANVVRFASNIMKPEAKAVVMLSLGNLSNVDYMRSVVENREVNAVISLPKYLFDFPGTLNILSLSKKNNDEIVFIDLSDTECIKEHLESLHYPLPLDKFVSKLISNKEPIPGISAVVQYEKLGDSTLIPSAHIRVSYAGRSKKMIMKELRDVYREIDKLARNALVLNRDGKIKIDDSL